MISPQHCYYIDFEYNNSKEQKLNLVACVVISIKGELRFWLHNNDIAKKNLKNYLLTLRENNKILICYNGVAEASSLISLGLDPSKFNWVDLQLEYKMLLNHWDKYRYGKQLDGDKEITTSRPLNKWEVSKVGANHSRPKTSLSSALYKMLDVKIDTEHKNKMRDLIISNPVKFSIEEQEQILDYCASDVKYLGRLKGQIIRVFRSSSAIITLKEVLWRGECSARTALMTCLGYPVDGIAVKKFASNVHTILNEIAEDINEQFPKNKIFFWNKKTGVYSKSEKPQREWILEQNFSKPWRLTEGGKGEPKLSLSLNAYEDHFSFNHEYPKDNYAAQIIRYLKTKQNMNGFLPTKKNNFFDSLGTDMRSRPWLNPYGAQSSRFQPKATGFIPLKAAWMRSLIRPKGGKLIASIDYSSEEFLLSALLSRDKAMFQAYKSGDPYFHTAKLAKAVPQGAKRKDYEGIRTLFKSTTLGISYLMGAVGLSNKLTQDTGDVFTEEKAQSLIDTFFRVYSGYKDYLDKVVLDYEIYKHLKLKDGWVMFGDNDNPRSVSNCPIQGMGAVVLRKAIQLAQDAGLKVLFPLHDALYIEFKEDRLDTIDTLYDCMKEAFMFQFDNKVIKNRASKIRMDIDVWGNSLEYKKYKTPLGRDFKGQKIYIDPRSSREYSRFSKYFI